MKALAIMLYGMGAMSFSAIGRLLGVSDVAVLKWVRAEAAALPQPQVSSAETTVEVDEMWHYKAGGSRRDGRTELQALLGLVQPGDTLVVIRIDRLARLILGSCSRSS